MSDDPRWLLNEIRREIELMGSGLRTLKILSDLAKLEALVLPPIPSIKEGLEVPSSVDPVRAANWGHDMNGG